MFMNREHEPTYDVCSDIVDHVARRLWDFAWDVHNDRRFMGDHDYGGYMPFVYAALQRYQWLLHGDTEEIDPPPESWVKMTEAMGVAVHYKPTRHPGKDWLWDEWDPDGFPLWLQQVAMFLPWLWD